MVEFLIKGYSTRILGRTESRQNYSGPSMEKRTGGYDGPNFSEKPVRTKSGWTTDKQFL